MSDLLRKPELTTSHEFENSEPIDFESYRNLCDAIDGFRKVGVQEEEAYRLALEDKRTVFAEYANSKIPLLTPLENEKMYDTERTIMMSGKEKAMLLAIPLQVLEQMQLDSTFEIDEDTVVIVEEFVAADEPIALDDHDTSRLPFINAKPIDFKNPNLSRAPGNETAWMAAYTFDMNPEIEQLKPYEGGGLVGEIMSRWQEYCAKEGKTVLPGETSTGTFLMSAEQLTERWDIVEQLWEISQIGFGEILGEHHPVAMEFNRQFFEKQMGADNTVTAVHCVDGEVECFGFIGLDMKNNEWLNEKSSPISEVINKAQEGHRALVQFHELIGRGRRGMGYATKVLNTLFDTISKTQYPFSVFFESTNSSSMYIPPLIIRDLGRSETMSMGSDISTIGKLSYWALVAGQHEQRAD